MGELFKIYIYSPKLHISEQTIRKLEEKNNRLTKDIKRLSKEKRELENKLKIYEHELICCDGLYASDNEEFEDCFRLDFGNIISKW